MIYTFYSFKGGVGRSMAMANIGYFLSQRGLKVLMVDFDLEAPGLERYFQSADPKHKSEEIQTFRGLIDLLISYKDLRSISNNLNSSKPESVSIQQPEPYSQKVSLEQNTNIPVTDLTSDMTDNLSDKDNKNGQANDKHLRDINFPFPVEPISNFIVPVYEETKRGGALYLMPSGRRALAFNEENIEKNEELSKKELARYAERVRSFAWDDFYINWEGEKFFDWFRTEANKLADIVLIDSRTGFTEMSGVCTYDLPDVVVMFVAPNEQNLEGTVKIAEHLASRELVEKGRKGRDLELIFVPSRVDINEKIKSDNFAERFKSSLLKFSSNEIKFADNPFLDLQIPYVPFYAFTEYLAFQDNDSPISSLLTKPLERLSYTFSQLEPSSNGKLRSLFISKELPQAATAKEKNKFAEQNFRLLSADEQKEALPILSRLVQVEKLIGSNQDLAITPDFNDFSFEEKKLIYLMDTNGLVKIEINESNEKTCVQLKDKTFPQDWKRLKEYLDKERNFLFWRQQLKTNIEQWSNTREDRKALLSGESLKTAKEWLKIREENLNDTEQSYIRRSSKRAFYNQLSLVLVIFGLVISIYAGFALLQSYNEKRRLDAETKQKEEKEEAEKVIDQQAQEFNSQGLKSIKEREDYETAIELYTSAIELRPQNEKFYIDRGEAYLRDSEYELAENDLLKAIELAPSNDQAYGFLGEVYYRQKNYPSSIKSLSQAIELNPASPIAYYTRGLSYKEMKEVNRAIDNYSKAIELEPKYGAAYLERGLIYKDLREFEKATRDLQRAIEVTDIPSIVSEAKTNLQLIPKIVKSQNVIPKQQPEVPKQQPAPPKIYLHYADKYDLNLLTEISNSLKSGYDVQGIEFISGSVGADVRYYYDEDKQTAEAIRNKVNKGLASRGIKLNLKLSFLGKLYKRVNRGTIEIWLPPVYQGSKR
jgi:tetratricopeptide (TPR) repeat protein/MinD-like ATPase involved in chromosome partitioning or flagellar assembly